jgi:hypothetical protein
MEVMPGVAAMAEKLGAVAPAAGGAPWSTTWQSAQWALA